MFLRILTLFIVLTFVSCSSDDDTQFAELNANRELWESHQIENYNWLETLSCKCNIPLKRTIFVVNNVKTEVVFDESLLFGNTSQDIFDTSNTVNEAFDFIKSIIRRKYHIFSC